MTPRNFFNMVNWILLIILVAFVAFYAGKGHAQSCFTVVDIKRMVAAGAEKTGVTVVYKQSKGLKGGYLVTIGDHGVAVKFQFDKNGCATDGGTGKIDPVQAARQYFGVELEDLFGGR